MKKVTTFVATQNFELWYGVESSGGGWNHQEWDLLKSLKEGDVIEVTLLTPNEKFPRPGKIDLSFKFPDGTSSGSYNFVIGIYITQGKIRQLI